MRPKPEYIIIGNDQGFTLNNNCVDFLEELLPEVKVDVLDNFTAASTFNSCMTDAVKAYAFLTLN